jgi:apoptosis-inducing factor 2
MTTADEGHLENTVLISYDKLFVNNNGKLKVGRVASINDRKEGGGGGELVLTSGETILYDALVLAPGSHWDGPLAFPDGKEETIAYINEWRRKFEAAQSIVLGGGGAVGIGECHTFSIVVMDLSH